MLLVGPDQELRLLQEMGGWREHFQWASAESLNGKRATTSSLQFGWVDETLIRPAMFRTGCYLLGIYNNKK
jgi:hypothetical protein